MSRIARPSTRRRVPLALALLGALLTWGLAWGAAPPGGTKVGQPAPPFALADTAGKTWSLADLKGKKVILEWTNDGCPYVRKHYGGGNMQALQREATAAGTVWLTVISSAPGTEGHVTPAEADRLTTERKAAPTAVLLDPTGTLGHAYGAKTTPHLFVIDAAGTLVYMGGIDDRPTADPADIPGARNYVRQAMADLDAGRPLADPVTRPYGCSVKY
ncbi:MAG TPA: thioredoxin family protein [Lamprocystis sp. (in: g-proteobacteria)]|nr:thioredoxin family protein [Lamprocystis sp. (in: g-proteobacteria)]